MKFYMESYGCTLNHGEAGKFIEKLTKLGHERVDEPKLSDAIAIFTCTVIRTTELKMLRQLRKFVRFGKPIIVSGCMAVVQKEDIRGIIPDVNFLEPKDISNLHELLVQIFGSDVNEKKDTGLLTDNDKKTGLKSKNSIDAIIPISTGCFGKCKYCITRLARGALSSIPEDKILDELHAALSSERCEIRLTAQDTACYGMDFNSSLTNLLKKIVRIKSSNDFRVRVGMMNPDTAANIVSDLITCYKHDRIFKFLHLPLQSGDDDLLHAMGRNYTRNDFIEIVERFRSEIPELTLSTDIIVGYPGETESGFLHSFELLEKVKPNIVNITRFSSRPGTEAAAIKNSIPGRVVKSRSRKLTALRFRISKDLNESKLGNKYKVLVTERVKEGSVLARTDSYLPVVIKQQKHLGSWHKVTITDVQESYLIGEPIS